MFVRIISVRNLASLDNVMFTCFYFKYIKV